MLSISWVKLISTNIFANLLATVSYITLNILKLILVNSIGPIFISLQHLLKVKELFSNENVKCFLMLILHSLS